MDQTQTARRALTRHQALTATESGYRYDQTAFPVAAHIEADTLLVTTTVPTLAAVIDGSVGEAVISGWYDTLRRRLSDLHKALTVDAAAVDLETTKTDTTVTVTCRIELSNPGQVGEDTVAVAQFIEGTYLQGVIPGYEYTDPVQSLLQQASAAAGSDDDDPSRGGTPL